MAQARPHFHLWTVLEAQEKWDELEAAATEFLAAKPEHPDALARLERARAMRASGLSAPASPPAPPGG